MKYQNMNLPDGFFQGVQQAKNLVTDSVNSMTQAVQPFIEEPWNKTKTQVTNTVIDQVTRTLGQAKASVEETVQTAEQIRNTTSGAIQTAISSSVNDWLTEHPAILQLVKILGWATNHPILSLVILIFSIAIFWNFIKIIGRLIELVSLSILRLPVKLLQIVAQGGVFSLQKISGLLIRKMTPEKTTNTILTLPPTISQSIHKDKQQRLTEITQRLEAIQKEQHLLLQEAAELLDIETIEITRVQ
jgi:hypothetical protein